MPTLSLESPRLGFAHERLALWAEAATEAHSHFGLHRVQRMRPASSAIPYGCRCRWARESSGTRSERYGSRPVTGRLIIYYCVLNYTSLDRCKTGESASWWRRKVCGCRHSKWWYMTTAKTPKPLRCCGKSTRGCELTSVNDAHEQDNSIVAAVA